MHAHVGLNKILARWRTPDLATNYGERAVDCGLCAKLAKCCDFQPFVANFLLGALLESGYALPPLGEGVIQTALGWIASENFREMFLTEARADLRCAFLVHGKCSIWWARPGECSAYLCGPKNSARERLSEEAFRLETSVAQMALAMQGFPAREIARQVDRLNGLEGRSLATLPEAGRPSTFTDARGPGRERSTPTQFAHLRRILEPKRTPKRSHR